MQFSRQFFLLGLLGASCVFALPSDGVYQDKQNLKGMFDGLVNDTINQLLENISEPIVIKDLPLSFNSSLLDGEADISNFKLSGLKQLVATKIDVSVLDLAMNATIVVPQLSLDTKYYADLVLAELLPIYGGGQAGITLDEIEITLGGKISVSPSLGISNVKIQVGLGNAIFDLHGLLNNEEFSLLLDQVLNDNVANFLNKYKETIGNIIGPIVEVIINSLLSPKNTTEIFGDIDLSYLKEIYN